MSYALATDRLGRPGLTATGVMSEIAGVRAAMDPRVLPAGRSSLEAGLDALAQVWPGTYPDSLATDYPSAGAHLDTWARAAFVHAMADVMTRRMPPRPMPDRGDASSAVYTCFYALTWALQGVAK